MESKSTLIQLDLSNSSKSMDIIEKELGTEKGTRAFVDHIKLFVDKAIASFKGKTPNSNDIQALGGDGYRIFFDDAVDAYEFVKKFGEIVQEYNNNPGREKRTFHIGAATGEVDWNQSQDDIGVDGIVGQYVCATAKQLCEEAEAGYFYVDKNTYEKIPKTGFENKKVLLKHGTYIDVWYIRFISDISTSTNQVISTSRNRKTSREEVSELLNTLDTFEIIMVARNIDINENSLSQNYVDNQRGNAINALLDTAKRRSILDELKNAIQEQLDNRNK